MAASEWDCGKDPGWISQERDDVAREMETGISSGKSFSFIFIAKVGIDEFYKSP